jgi:Predicted membrane protein (DUF2306)
LLDRMTNASRQPSFPPRPFKWSILAALFLLGAWFLAIEVVDSVTRDRSDEPLARSLVSIIHLVFALPLLLFPPLQFSRRVRARWPIWHRRVGQVYLAAATVAALAAIYLGATFESVGRRPPLLIFASLWLAFSVAAWICARRRAFAAHERFVVRSYTIALAFAFVRTLGEFEGTLLAFIPDKDLSGVTREWLSFVVPLLVVECYYSWWPSVRSTKFNDRSAKAA